MTEYPELIEYANTRPGYLVLDVGCGYCQYYNEKSAFELIGLDKDRETLKIAYFGFVKEMTKRKNLSPVRGDGMYLPFGDNQFDAVISRRFLCCYSNPRNAVEEMIRVLKPGKKIVLAPRTSWELGWFRIKRVKMTDVLKKNNFYDVNEREDCVHGTKPI